MALGLEPVFLIKADVGEAKETFELHADCPVVLSDFYALSEVICGLVHVTLEQICNGQLAIAQAGTLVIL